jgi:hypothetical protein
MGSFVMEKANSRNILNTYQLPYGKFIVASRRYFSQAFIKQSGSGRRGFSRQLLFPVFRLESPSQLPGKRKAKL